MKRGIISWDILIWTYEIGKFLDKHLERKWKKMANRIDIDEISIDEMRTYINKNTEENSVWIWTCLHKEKRQ